jgi:hypothetical protein
MFSIEEMLKDFEAFEGETTITILVVLILDDEDAAWARESGFPQGKLD